MLNPTIHGFPTLTSPFFSILYLSIVSLSPYICDSNKDTVYRAAGAANKSQLRRREEEEENNPLTIGLL